MRCPWCGKESVHPMTTIVHDTDEPETIMVCYTSYCGWNSKRKRKEAEGQMSKTKLLSDSITDECYYCFYKGPNFKLTEKGFIICPKCGRRWMP